MTDILRTIAVPALEEMGIRYFVDPHAPALVIPHQVPGGQRFLLGLYADDEAGEMVVAADLVTVPPRRRARTALVLAELNTTHRFVSFGLAGDVAGASIGIELTHAADARALVSLGVRRMLLALDGAYERVAAAARQRASRPPRVLSDAARVLDDLGFAS